MSTTEDRLRDAFRADADTIRPQSLPGVPGRPARPARRGRQGWFRQARFLAPAAAAAAVVAIVTAVSLIVAPGVPSRRPGTPTSSAGTSLPLPVFGKGAVTSIPSSAAPPGIPRYSVTAEFGPVGTAGDIVVRDTRTGTITGTVRAPYGSDFDAVAATAGDRAFIADAGLQNGGPSPTRLYMIQLSSRGKPGRLTPLHITIPGPFLDALAVTPDGRTIAYSGPVGDRPPLNDTGDVSVIGVMNLASRRTRTWEIPVSSATFIYGSATGLSLSADGAVLGYGFDSGVSGILRTSTAGTLAQRGRIVSRTATWAAVGAGGSTLFTCSVAADPGFTSDLFGITRGSVTYSAQPGGGGRQHIIASFQHVDWPSCQASLDPSGRYLLVEYPAAPQGGVLGVEPAAVVRPAVLDIATGKLSFIPGPGYSNFTAAAW
jgi:hypothetical protein